MELTEFLHGDANLGKLKDITMISGWKYEMPSSLCDLKICCIVRMSLWIESIIFDQIDVVLCIFDF